jgi:dUTP pyrophosphatase
MLKRILLKILKIIWKIISDCFLYGIPGIVVEEQVVQLAIQRLRPSHHEPRELGNMLFIKTLDPTIQLPTWNGTGNAGLDIRSNEYTTLEHGKITLVSTGIATEFSEEYVVLLRDRSGLAVKGLHVLAGVIDSSYRGEWKVVLMNLSDTDYNIVKGERIAQAIIVRREQLEIKETQVLSNTARGDGGFGSTGRK